MCPRIPHCGCTSVRIGCLIYGYLNIGYSLASIIFFAVGSSAHQMGGIGGMVSNTVVHIILVVGLHMYIKLIVKIYEIFLWVLVAVLLVLMVVALVALEWLWAVGMLLLAVFFCVVNLFIRSAYLEIKEEAD
ncbi:uncharacterized protein LOC119692740 [Plutella xylostella]|uniref:uncharacterized protein LOC119692740 n=1 Tax=Plutella xylostella TaxID=51655 RepID=UPI002033091F|nr:uncharacterized protein LOC119692740 [Plutella xylostella]